MDIFINDKQQTLAPGALISDAIEQFNPVADVVILNAIINPDAGTQLRQHDRLYLYARGSRPEQGDLSGLILARQPQASTVRLRAARVGIAGAGGLGSVVAENLARAGIGRLVIADFDVIEPSNLNRQRFSMRQLGLPKAAALADNLRDCCPFVEVMAVHERIDSDNCVHVFGDCDIVCECFDAAESKAALVAALRKKLPACMIVAASGLAGSGSARNITTRRMSDKLYIVGDMSSDVADGLGLFATRVGIVASLQSHVALQLILGEQI